MMTEGIELHRQKQDIALYRHTCRVMNTLYNSPKLPDHPHWKYTEYKTFQQYAAAVNFPEYPGFSITREELFDKVYAGWMATGVCRCRGHCY